VAVDVLVVGAGVIGLTTAIRTAEAGAAVLVMAADPPRETTSALAGAMAGPLLTPPGDRSRVWGQATVDELTARPGIPGVRVARGLLAARPAGMLPPFAEEIPGFRLCRPEELPTGFETGFFGELPLVDTPVYLDHLVERLQAAGGELRIGRVASLAEAARLAPRVANCAGLGARELVPDPDLQPVRGPKVVVDNPGLDSFFMEAPLGPAWTGFLPHGDHVVLAGRAAPGDEDLRPDPTEAEAMLRACAEVEPRLAGARVLEHRVGLRPSRPTVRLEAEPVGDALVVHNYGHGGEGVLHSWGCAAEAAALLTA
jgi:D-amino-acid oxidase